MEKIKDYKEDFTFKIGELSETIITYKFKDPRDALNYLVKHIRVLPRSIIVNLFDYIETEGYCKYLFNPMELYYYLILSLQIGCGIGMVRPWFNNLNEFSTINEIENLYKTLQEEMLFVNMITRESHKFAVANTWGIWNELNTNKVAFNRKNIEKLSINADKLFNETYKGKRIKILDGFHLDKGIWRIKFWDDSWILARDHNNGWYYPLTNFNSYKLLEPFRF